MREECVQSDQTNERFSSLREGRRDNISILRMKNERNGLAGPSGLTGFIQNQGNRQYNACALQECKGGGKHN